MRRLLTAAVLAVIVPHVAFARPAVIHVLEAAARTRPSRAAAILHVFVEGAEVSVSDEVQDGWRRVDLQHGSVGWIEESMLAFPEAAAASSDLAPIPAVLLVPPSDAAAPVADLGARTYVKDLSHLAMRVKGDLAVSPRAESLAARRRTSIGVWVVGGITSLALIGASASMDVPRSSDPKFGSALDDKGRMVTGALVVGVATGLIGMVIHPRRGELREVVDVWNAAHPDRKVEMAGESGD